MSEVLDGMDDTRAGPSTDSVVRILALEPGGESTRVATTDYNPVCLVTKVFVLTVNECGDIGESLLRGKELKILSLPVLEGLRGTIIAMLQRVKQGAMISTNHHWEHLVIGWRARPFTTNVKENWALLLFSTIVLVVEPVSLLVGSLVVLVEMVDLIVKFMRGIIIHADFQFPARMLISQSLGSENGSQDRSTDEVLHI